MGGIQPQPFRVLMPAGCFFARHGFRLENFLTCGVEITYDDGTRDTLSMAILNFEARLIPRTDGSYRFDIITTLIPPDDNVPPDPISPILGAIGGAAVQIELGSDASVSLPDGTETVSGVSPNPF